MSADVNFAKVSSDILIEFLEVAFHALLYARNLYPRTTFKRNKIYNVPVQICANPDVRTYVQQLVSSLRPYLEDGNVESVAFVVLDANQQFSLERFVFEITQKRQNPEGKAYLVCLEQALRAFMLKMDVSQAILTELPTDSTWTIQIHTKEADLLLGQQNQLLTDFMWGPADESQIQVQECNIVPLKKMDSELFQMQLYVEECGTKP